MGEGGHARGVCMRLLNDGQQMEIREYRDIVA